MRVSEVYFNFNEAYGRIVSQILDSNGDVVKTLVDEYTGAAVNTCWADFTDKKSLYVMAATKNNLPVDSIELNTIPDVVFEV